MALRLAPVLFFVALLGVAVLDAQHSTASKGAGDWTPKRYPDPTQDPEACGRPGVEHSWVCDPDGILSVEQRNVVEGILKAIAAGEQPYAKAACGSAGEVGAQVAVAVMQSFSHQLVMASDAERVAAVFAETLHNQWGVGHKECHDGALLLLSVDDRQVYVSRGEGVAAKLTDRVLDRIIEAMKQPLRAGRYGTAVEQAVVDIGVAIAAEHPQGDDGDGIGGAVVLGCFVAGFLGLAAYAARNSFKQQRQYDDCRAKLEALRRDQARLTAGGTYNPTSCPICLEDFDLPPGQQAPKRDDEEVPDDIDGKPLGDTPLTEPLLKNLKERVRTLDHQEQQAGGAGTSGSSGSSGGEIAAVVAGSGAAAGAAGAAAAAAAARAGSGGSGSSAAAASKVARKPLILPCKHQFCEPCISEWVAQRKTSCPVCRKPIDDSKPPDQPSSSRPPCHDGVEADAAQAQAQGGTEARTAEQEHLRRAYRGPYQGWSDPRYRARGYRPEDRMRDELLFRLLMLRRRYPAYIDDGMLNQWSDDVAQGRELNTSTWSTFQQRDPAVRAAMAQSGARGSSSGFGGGRSSGGRGSSW